MCLDFMFNTWNGLKCADSVWRSVAKRRLVEDSIVVGMRMSKRRVVGDHVIPHNCSKTSSRLRKDLVFRLALRSGFHNFVPHPVAQQRVGMSQYRSSEKNDEC